MIAGKPCRPRTNASLSKSSPTRSFWARMKLRQTFATRHHAKIWQIDGGRGGIRTHGRIAPTPDFESGAFNHSATLPLESTRLLICANHTPQQAELDPVNPSGLNPNFSRIELNLFRSYFITVFGSAFCLAQSPLTAPFFYM